MEGAQLTIAEHYILGYSFEGGCAGKIQSYISQLQFLVNDLTTSDSSEYHLSVIAKSTKFPASQSDEFLILESSTNTNTSLYLQSHMKRNTHLANRKSSTANHSLPNKKAGFTYLTFSCDFKTSKMTGKG